uniref:Uncharacterized protein n=1 Tax=Solibacter usitatus (strain Ellin6076) TaxID=234267 RepID=Q01UK4_SOLUE
MPNKADHDASEWKRRRARYGIPDPEPLLHPSVLPQENLADYELLVAEYYASLNPTCPEERSFVDDIIYCEWILRRLARTETELISHVHAGAGTTHADYPLGQPAAANPRLFTALQWRAISTRKALKESIDGLRDLRLHPIPDPEPPATPTNEDPLLEIGFVPEPPLSPHSESAISPHPSHLPPPGSPHHERRPSEPRP